MPPRNFSAASEARIAHIEGLMHGLTTYRSGVTDRALAKEWGMSLDSVHQLTHEASKRVRATLSNRDAIAVTVLTSAQAVIDRGQHPNADARDVRNLIDACTLLVKLAGLDERAVEAASTTTVIVQEASLDSSSDGEPVEAADAGMAGAPTQQ